MNRADLLDLSRMMMARPSNWNETLPRLPDGSQALRAWYDTSQAGKAFEDDAGTDPCEDTDGVRKLLDCSGFGNTLVQTDAGKTLTYRTNRQNGLPALVGTGGNDSLSIASDIVGVGDVTVFCVFNAAGWGGGGFGVICANGQCFIRITSAKLAISSNALVTQVYSAAASLAIGTTYAVCVSRTSAGLVNAYINGVLSGPANQDSGAPAAGSTSYVGNRSLGDRGFDGILPVVGVYGIILTAPQIAALTKELKTTWGIA